jgi:hypothetical protein
MRRIRFLSAMAGVCILVIAGGCAKQEKLSLKFNPGQASSYKVSTETIKDYKFEQPSVNQTKIQQTLNRAEITYNQKILSVATSGDAKALITIEKVKFIAKNPTGTSIDFDSSREGDKNNSLGKLVGQTYIITLSPTGEVVGVEDAQKARDAVKGDTLEQKTAQAMLTDEAIKQRHSVIAMPQEKNSAAKVGQTWNKLKAGPAGMLAPRSYEEIYTLKEIKPENGQQIAVVDMQARPSATKAPNLPKDEQKGLSFFEKMFDNKETYTGQMMMDITTGQVKSYNEKLKSEWVAVEPTEEVKSDKGPDVLTMGFTYSYSIEKVK